MRRAARPRCRRPARPARRVRPRRGSAPAWPHLTARSTREASAIRCATMSALLVAASAPPTVTSEQLRSLVLGILIGPEVLDWASEGTYIQFLANFGLALLFFFAGLEVIEKHVPRQAIVRGSLGWTISIGLGIGIGYLLQ